MARYIGYYAEGARYELPPELMPERGVQAIVQSNDAVGWYAITGYDYYVWIDGQWAGVDVFGLWDYLARPGWKRVLFGRTLLNEEYERIYQEALKDMGAKSTFLPGERKRG